VDVLISEAFDLMKRGAAELREGAASLRAARKLLRTHPDFRKTAKARAANPDAGLESTTFAWWLVDGIESVLDDAPAGEAAGWVWDDLRGGRRSLQRAIEDERRDLARRLRRASRDQEGARARTGPAPS
jgi:hypothetical protein